MSTIYLQRKFCRACRKTSGTSDYDYFVFGQAARRRSVAFESDPRCVTGLARHLPMSYAADGNHGEQRLPGLHAPPRASMACIFDFRARRLQARRVSPIGREIPLADGTPQEFAAVSRSSLGNAPAT